MQATIALSVYYAADFEQMTSLITFLTQSVSTRVSSRLENFQQMRFRASNPGTARRSMLTMRPLSNWTS